jgi:hypothetical protein
MDSKRHEIRRKHNMSENAGTKQQKENALPKEQLEAAKNWLQLVAKARSDKALKERLMDTPVVVLREHGINVRPGLDIHVVEDTPTEVYLKLPAPSTLTDADLEKVVGGTELEVGTGHLTPTPIYNAFGPVLVELAHDVIDTVSSVIPK